MAYETEEQQVEAIKNFWKENGGAIILGAVIGLGAIFGWKYYKNHQKEQAEAASASYNQAILAIKAGDTENTDFITKAQAVIEQYPEHSYASMAALRLASEYVGQNKLDKAAEQLQWIVDKGNSTFKSTAQIRLARILLQQEQYDKAVAVAKSIVGKSHESTRFWLEGEALLAQAKEDEAIALFKKAKDVLDTSAAEPMLVMRLNQFGLQ